MGSPTLRTDDAANATHTKVRDGLIADAFSIITTMKGPATMTAARQQAGVLIVFAVACLLSLLSPSATAADPSPRTVDEGVARLQKLLGTFKAKDARQFRMTIDNEFKNQPEEDKPPVLIISNGEVVIGTPYRVGDAVAFDVVESIKRTVYELRDGDQREEIRRQQRYMAARYTLRVDENGMWDFDMTFTAHSIPSVVGMPYLKGSVNWHDDGLELVGIGTDNSYAAEGKVIRTATYGKTHLSRSDKELSVNDEWQSYHLGTDPDGNVLPFPDFDQPIGDPGPWLSGKATLE